MSYQLRVNPIACTAHGLCAELLPEVIELDPWGYPILRSGTVPRHLVEHAKRAVTTCPTLALLMDKTDGRQDQPAGSRERRPRAGYSS